MLPRMNPLIKTSALFLKFEIERSAFDGRLKFMIFRFSMNCNRIVNINTAIKFFHSSLSDDFQKIIFVFAGELLFDPHHGFFRI